MRENKGISLLAFQVNSDLRFVVEARWNIYALFRTILSHVPYLPCVEINECDYLTTKFPKHMAENSPLWNHFMFICDKVWRLWSQLRELCRALLLYKWLFGTSVTIAVQSANPIHAWVLTSCHHSRSRFPLLIRGDYNFTQLIGFAFSKMSVILESLWQTLQILCHFGAALMLIWICAWLSIKPRENCM